VWEAYRDAYTVRYSVEPVRNATVNGQIATLVARVGRAEAPELARFYVGRNERHYVRARHPIGLLLHDWQGIRTQWAAGDSAGTPRLGDAGQRTVASIIEWERNNGRD